MNRISSRMTYYYKNIMPLMFFGLIAVFIGVSFFMTNKNGEPASPPLAFFVFIVIVGGIIFMVLKKLVFDMADEVTDGGDFLTVRFGREEDQIVLKNIVNISYSFSRPPRALVTLRQPCKFGKEIAFCPITPVGSDLFRFMRFRNAIIDDLVQRVDAKRPK